jgi:hypothetical protein
MVEPCRLDPLKLLLPRNNRRGRGDDQDCGKIFEGDSEIFGGD